MIRLVARIGLDRNVDHTKASCRFHIRVRSKVVFATEILRANAAPRAIDVPLAEANEFDLVVDDAGDGRGWDQGDWAEAKGVLQDGSEIWLNDLPVDGPLPFSFVYGGKPFSEFLHLWIRAIKDEKLFVWSWDIMEAVSRPVPCRHFTHSLRPPLDAPECISLNFPRSQESIRQSNADATPT